jgi:large subunit ribosomal protein L9
MKTEVILTHNIVGLGGESDQVKVASGYARNYLFPQRLAVPLTQSNKRQIEALRQRRAEREAHEFNTMSELAKGVSKLTCVIKVKAGEDGKMFGSVTAGMIADELKHQFDIVLDKKKIHLEHALRATGEFEIELHLHPEVKGTLKVRIESLTPAPEAAPGAEDAKAEKPRTEKRAHAKSEAEAEKPVKAAATGEKKSYADKVKKAAKTAKAPKAEKKEKAD